MTSEKRHPSAHDALRRWLHEQVEEQGAPPDVSKLATAAYEQLGSDPFVRKLMLETIAELMEPILRERARIRRRPVRRGVFDPSRRRRIHNDAIDLKNILAPKEISLKDRLHPRRRNTPGEGREDNSAGQ
jgi:hypothetical protein